MRVCSILYCLIYLLTFNIVAAFSFTTEAQHIGAFEHHLEQSWFSLIMLLMFRAASTAGKVVIRICSESVSTVLASPFNPFSSLVGKNRGTQIFFCQGQIENSSIHFE